MLPVKFSAVCTVCATLAFAAPASAQLRPMVYAETTVDTTPTEAFADWVSDERIEDFFAAEATIEAKPGGLYHLCFAPDAPAGSCGNDAGRILGLQEGHMLAFTWAMPPYMPDIRPHLTSVQILFEPVGASQTRVRLFHTGFGEGEAWNEGRTYFAKTWPQVLESYRVDVAG